MLTKDERTVLENLLDSLDRLFDRVSSVSEVYAVFVASSTALRQTRFEAAFTAPTEQLRTLVQSSEPPDRKRELALVATDELRKFIAEELRRDTKENHKRRHAR